MVREHILFIGKKAQRDIKDLKKSRICGKRHLSFN